MKLLKASLFLLLALFVFSGFSQNKIELKIDSRLIEKLDSGTYTYPFLVEETNKLYHTLFDKSKVVMSIYSTNDYKNSGTFTLKTNYNHNRIIGHTIGENICTIYLANEKATSIAAYSFDLKKNAWLTAQLLKLPDSETPVCSFIKDNSFYSLSVSNEENTIFLRTPKNNTLEKAGTYDFTKKFQRKKTQLSSALSRTESGQNYTVIRDDRFEGGVTLSKRNKVYLNEENIRILVQESGRSMVHILTLDIDEKTSKSVSIQVPVLSSCHLGQSFNSCLYKDYAVLMVGCEKNLKLLIFENGSLKSDILITPYKGHEMIVKKDISDLKSNSRNKSMEIIDMDNFIRNAFGKQYSASINLTEESGRFFLISSIVENSQDSKIRTGPGSGTGTGKGANKNKKTGSGNGSGNGSGSGAGGGKGTGGGKRDGSGGGNRRIDEIDEQGNNEVDENDRSTQKPGSGREKMAKDNKNHLKNSKPERLLAAYLMGSKPGGYEYEKYTYNKSEHKYLVVEVDSKTLDPKEGSQPEFDLYPIQKKIDSIIDQPLLNLIQGKVNPGISKINGKYYFGRFDAELNKYIYQAIPN